MSIEQSPPESVPPISETETAGSPAVIEVAKNVVCVRCGSMTPVNPTEEQISTGRAESQAQVVRVPPTGIPLKEIERHGVLEALHMSNWVQKDAAELLSISPRVMSYKIKKHGIQFPADRPRRHGRRPKT